MIRRIFYNFILLLLISFNTNAFYIVDGAGNTITDGAGNKIVDALGGESPTPTTNKINDGEMFLFFFGDIDYEKMDTYYTLSVTVGCSSLVG